MELDQIGKIRVVKNAPKDFSKTLLKVVDDSTF